MLFYTCCWSDWERGPEAEVSRERQERACLATPTTRELDLARRVSQVECYFSTHVVMHSRLSAALRRKKLIAYMLMNMYRSFQEGR